MITASGIDQDQRLVCKWPKPNKQADAELLVTEPLRFWFIRSGKTYVHTIKPGFTTDLASDPLDRRGRWDYGSVVHDYLYENKGNLPTVKLTRKECDDIFYYIMEQCNPTDVWKSYFDIKNRITWATVRVFGDSYWND